MKKLFSTTALALTLAFSGLSYADDGNWQGKGMHDGSPAYMEDAISKLPDKDAAQLRNAMKQAKDNNKALWDQAKKLHDDMRNLLTAADFDQNAFISKSNDLQALHDKMHANMTQAFASAVSQLPQDERKTLADNMHEHHWHHHKDHDKSGSDDASSSPSQQ